MLVCAGLLCEFGAAVSWYGLRERGGVAATADASAPADAAVGAGAPAAAERRRAGRGQGRRADHGPGDHDDRRQDHVDRTPPAHGLKAVTRDWDARTYDRVADPQTRWGEVVLDRLPLDGDKRVLDAGCGAAVSPNCSPPACLAVASWRSTGRRR